MIQEEKHHKRGPYKLCTIYITFKKFGVDILIQRQYKW